MPDSKNKWPEKITLARPYNNPEGRLKECDAEHKLDGNHKEYVQFNIALELRYALLLLKNDWDSKIVRENAEAILSKYRWIK